MKDRYRLWTSHGVGLILMSFGVWWFVENVSSIPDYKIIICLVAMGGFVLNHFRWHRLANKLDDLKTFRSVSTLVLSNYMILLLVLVMAGLRSG